jgi:hypothetical protein
MQYLILQGAGKSTIANFITFNFKDASGPIANIKLLPRAYMLLIYLLRNLIFKYSLDYILLGVVA